MTSPESNKRGAGRPRNLDLDQLIRTATLELLADGGEAAAALDDVAARAGVGKATIYRRWTTKRQMILDAVTSSLPIELPTDRGNLHVDVRELLTHLVALLDAPHARAAASFPSGVRSSTRFKKAASFVDLYSGVKIVWLWEICAVSH